MIARARLDSARRTGKGLARTPIARPETKGFTETNHGFVWSPEMVQRDSHAVVGIHQLRQFFDGHGVLPNGVLMSVLPCQTYRLVESREAASTPTEAIRNSDRYRVWNLAPPPLGARSHGSLPGLDVVLDHRIERWRRARHLRLRARARAREEEN